MPIKSFLAHPQKGKKQELIESLKDFAECEIIPSSNKEVVVLITDTNDKQSDVELHEKLNAIESLQMLSMVSGFDNKELNNTQNV